MRLTNCKQVLMSATRVLTPSSPFLDVEGADNANIVVGRGDLSKAASPAVFKAGALARIVSQADVRRIP